MSSNSRKLNPLRTLSNAWKVRIGSLTSPAKVAFQEEAAKLAPTKSASSAASAADLSQLRAEVAAAQATVRKGMVPAILSSVQVADKVVPANLRELLDRGLDVIATGPVKDYNPGTDGKVQTLIHPSLFPYIEGASPVLDRSALPPTSAATPFRRWRRDWETSKYQWLPAQFGVDEFGSITVKSYINNLDLSHQELYRAIELCFSLFLPMFEKILDKPLRSRELQVIVKAVNYVIQPGGQTYKGEWHVEGMSHEHIVASGVYYYSTTPHLTDSGLAFREKDMYDNETALGDVPTTEGRLLAFSNGLQHQVSGIVNKSKTKVGIRKILGFFLVDPDREIVSTKHVPEQQWDRLRPPIMTALDEVVMKKIGRSMPTEILLEIMEWAKTGFTLEEAHQHREALLEERRYNIDKANSLRSMRQIHLVD